MTTRNWHALGAIVLTTASLFAQDFSTVRLGQAAALGSMNNFSGGLHFFRWRNARLVAWDKDHQPTGRIGIYNSNAKLDLEKMVSFPIEHATDVSLVSADMARSGELVASGLATQQDGAVARFLARISPNGTVMKLVRTEPYLPQYICAADDGSVWTVGEERLFRSATVQFRQRASPGSGEQRAVSRRSRFFRRPCLGRDHSVRS